MTLHIALSNAVGSVMLSDSQGSTETSATHGHQKQYIGCDFLVGSAGSSLVAEALFHALSKYDDNDGAVAAADLQTYLQTFFRQDRSAECHVVSTCQHWRWRPKMIAMCS